MLNFVSRAKPDLTKAVRSKAFAQAIESGPKLSFILGQVETILVEQQTKKNKTRSPHALKAPSSVIIEVVAKASHRSESCIYSNASQGAIPRAGVKAQALAWLLRNGF
ncbi:MAG: hypothetical protein AAGH74_04780 [Pseudomonadota bacterium]